MSEWPQQPDPEEDGITPITSDEYETLVRTVEEFVRAEGATEQISVVENSFIRDLRLDVDVSRLYGQSPEETENLKLDRATLYFRVEAGEGKGASITVDTGMGQDTRVSIFNKDSQKVELDPDGEIVAAKLATDLAKYMLIQSYDSSSDTPDFEGRLLTAYGLLSTLLKTSDHKFFTDMIMARPDFEAAQIIGIGREVKRFASALGHALRKRKAGNYTNTKTLYVDESLNMQIEFRSMTGVSYDADLSPVFFIERDIKLNAYYKSLQDGKVSVIEECVSLGLHDNTAKLEKGTDDITALGYQGLDYDEIEYPARDYTGSDLDDFHEPERDADQLEVGLFHAKIAAARIIVGNSKNGR